MNKTIIFNDIEFSYEELVVTKIESTQIVNTYVKVNIEKGNCKYPTGYKLDQISVLNLIRFENEDGSENKGNQTQLEIETDNKEDLINKYDNQAISAKLDKN
jgi:hypothetical protein